MDNTNAQVAFIQNSATATERKEDLLKRELLVSSRQFIKVFILNQLKFAATEIYEHIFTGKLTE